MKKITIIVIYLFLFSCGKKEDTVPSNKKDEKQFEMYQLSEMAILMEQIYVNNLQLKSRIEKKEFLGEFPKHFLDIKTAVMTKKQYRDDFFKDNSQLFLDQQYKIYSEPEKAKEHFNKGIDACIKCHEARCTGPIERIKKLYIQ
jgi:hypothetical protein